FNGFTLTYLLTGGGPGGATRVYAILAYEYGVQALRYSSGVAVAMTVAPFLFILILVLGRYMMRREDVAHASDEDSLVWRGAMAVLWPVRMLIRGVVGVFWAVNAAAETVCGAIADAVRRPGSTPMLPRDASRRLGSGVLY